MPLSSRAWQLIAETRIEQAIRDGSFDNLPGFGEPLSLEGEANDEHWWIRQKARREKLEMLPPALMLKREVQRSTDRIMRLDDETAVRKALQRLNDFIAAANLKVLWGPPSDVISLDVEAWIRKWQDRHE
jgi:hypothetical protein